MIMAGGVRRGVYAFWFSPVEWLIKRARFAPISPAAAMVHILVVAIK